MPQSVFNSGASVTNTKFAVLRLRFPETSSYKPPSSIRKPYQTHTRVPPEAARMPSQIGPRHEMFRRRKCENRVAAALALRIGVSTSKLGAHPVAGQGAAGTASVRVLDHECERRGRGDVSRFTRCTDAQPREAPASRRFSELPAGTVLMSAEDSAMSRGDSDSLPLNERSGAPKLLDITPIMST
jgi:hypothetical protein